MPRTPKKSLSTPKRQTGTSVRLHHLKHKVLELSALMEISRLLNSSLDLKSIADHILLTTMGRLLISKSLFFIRQKNDTFEILTGKGLPKHLIGQPLTIADPPDKPVFISDVSSPTLWQQFLQKQKIAFIVPVLLKEEVKGLIAYGPKLSGKPVDKNEMDFLLHVADLAASSLHNGIIVSELRKVNQQLDKKIQELNTLFDIGRGLQSSLDADRIIKLLGYGLMGEMMMNQFMILIRRNEQIQIAEKKGFTRLTLPSEVKTMLFALDQPSYTNDLPEEIRHFFSETAVQAVIPMRSQDETKGILLTGPRMNGDPVTTDDLNFLYTLGNQALLSLENAWLFEDSLERKRLEEELELARTIQTNLLPKSFPEISPFVVYGKNISSSQVGGDYFDIIRTGEDTYLLAIADVSGKGIPASLLMSNLQAGLMALSQEIKEPSRLVARLNNIIHANTGSDKFITLFAGILHCRDGTLTYVNAGHNPPYHVFPDGHWKTLQCGGLILGMLPDIEYEQETVHLHPGESVILFTDGITEALNRNGELYDEKRLEEWIQQHHALPAPELTEKLIESVQIFAGNTPQSDDITVLVIQHRS